MAPYDWAFFTDWTHDPWESETISRLGISLCRMDPRKPGSEFILGGSVGLTAEDDLPEGAQLVVTAHRKVSQHTVSFAAKNVPLP